MYTKLLMFIILALFTACAPSNSIKDTWPGIDDESFKLKNNISTLSNNNLDVFSFTTQILLPKMGADVSYTITSTCTRILPIASTKKMLYSKTTVYPATKFKNPLHLQTFEHLPEEMIIFPKHFSKCDFKLNAKNQNSSTDSALLKNQVFKILPNEHHLSIARTRKQQTQKKTALPLKTELFKFIVRSLDSKRIKNLETICYTNKIKFKKTPKINHSQLNANRILFPKETKDFPLEYCRLKAVLINTKKIVFSPVFKFINREHLPIIKTSENLKIPPSPSSKVGISYNSSSFIDILALFKINFINTSNKDSLQIRIHAEDSIQNIFLINTLKYISNTYNRSVTKYFYRPNFKPVSTYFAWVVPKTGNTTSIIKLKPKKMQTLEFKAFPSFKCSNNHKELGFVIAPEKNNPLFNYSLINKNDFISEAIYTKNILFNTNLKINVNNIPIQILKPFLNSSEFQLYFRNQNVLPNRNIDFVSTRHQSYEKVKRVIFTGPLKDYNLYPPPKEYPLVFNAYVKKDTTKCTPLRTIQKDGVSPDGEPILQPLENRSVDL